MITNTLNIVALNFEKIGKNPERITEVKPFISENN